MRIFALSLIGLSALILSACDELATRHADKDCCCANTCPTPAPTKTAEAPPPATPVAPPVAAPVPAEAGYHRKVVRRWKHSGGGARYVSRSSTEGVGYLDEDLAGGYRRVGSGGGYRSGTSVSIEESERYSRRESRSESGYAYGYSEGYESRGEMRDGRRGGHGRRRHYQGYTGVDRDGYLTWPGKTP
ncbi:MAG: hypothetical protein KF842_03465 [Caulobacter sp.]|nr:hypothetical protein [Caulobacter sp.]